MRQLIIIFSLIAFTSCSLEDAEKQREETLHRFDEKKEEIESEIAKLKDLSEQVSEEAKQEVENALKDLKKQRELIKKEAENLKEASKKELEKALEKAKKEYKDWLE